MSDKLLDCCTQQSVVHVSYRRQFVVRAKGKVQSMDTTEATSSPNRKVSLPLLLGICFLPLVFSWLLLEKGYSKSARLGGFGWLALSSIWMALLVQPPPANQQHEPAAQVAVTKPVAPTAEIAPERKASSHDEALADLRRLFEQLQVYRRDPEFRKIGFDPCCRFHQWQLEVRALSKSDGTTLLQQYRVVPGDLETLASQYLFHPNQQTELRSDLEDRLRLALYQRDVPKGRGTVIEEAYGCQTYDQAVSTFRLAEHGEYAASDAALRRPGCEKVRIGTRIGPVLQRRPYSFEAGGTTDQLLVRLPNGHELWLDEGDVEFE